MNWTKILIQITEGVQDIASPFADDGRIEYYYVLVNETDRIGFLWAWCTKTFKGIYMSRVGIPLNVPFVTPENFKKIKVPKIIWTDINGKVVK
jgi:hypothetical protein